MIETIILTLVWMWIINSFLSISMMLKVSFSLMDDVNFNRDKIDNICYYHVPLRIKSWFGFRHWFYPYKNTK